MHSVSYVPLGSCHWAHALGRAPYALDLHSVCSCRSALVATPCVLRVCCVRACVRACLRLGVYVWLRRRLQRTTRTRATRMVSTRIIKFSLSTPPTAKPSSPSSAPLPAQVRLRPLPLLPPPSHSRSSCGPPSPFMPASFLLLLQDGNNERQGGDPSLSPLGWGEGRGDPSLSLGWEEGGGDPSLALKSST